MLAILGAGLGVLLSAIGYSFTEWQFWAVFAFAIAFYFVGSLE